MNPKTLFEKYIDTKGVLIAILIILFGLFVIILSALITPFNDWSCNPNSILFSQYGDFIGGFIGPVFSLAAFILLYKTFIEQRKSLIQQRNASKAQNENFQQERTDNLFFNLLKSQSDISNNIRAYFFALEKNQPISRLVETQEFFLYSKMELTEIWKSLNEDYKYQFSSDTIRITENEKEDIYNEAGLGKLSFEEVAEKVKGIDDYQKTSYVNKYYNITKLTWEGIREKEMKDKAHDMYSLFLDKYNYAIGHYFRHLYHILLFIEQTEESLMQKSNNKHEIESLSKKYIDFLQAQMSSYELMLLFYNCLVFPKMLKLVTKYNFLENLACEDLIDQRHNCIDGINLKNRTTLLGL